MLTLIFKSFGASQMSSHGSPPLRGLMSTSRSSSFEGRFGRMFRSLPVANYGNTDAETIANLKVLGTAMEAPFDSPKDTPDTEESGIPALYTYFGQFIDHDLTFGPEGSFQKQRDPDALVDFRTPAFDLDCVYGRGPGDQPYLYEGDKFLLGKSIKGGVDDAAHDLPRNQADPARALIGDPRNDENVLVSQLHGLFLRFHNRLLTDNIVKTFDEAQRELQRHYQYVILNDFLPRIIDKNVLDELKTNDHYDRHKIRFYKPKRSPFIPLEFSTAAYRFGHSMIRPGYRLNDSDDTLLSIFSSDPLKDLRGKHAMDERRGIDWGRLIDIDERAYGDPDKPVDENKKRLQFAYRIDTSLVNPLGKLPPNVAETVVSLSTRNLLRSFSLGLPSGQAVARAMNVEVLPGENIVIGKAVEIQDAGASSTPIEKINPVFKDNCPLWTYILAEAMQHKIDVTIPVKGPAIKVGTTRLGPVGGRIVAETFLGLMFEDPFSLLRTDSSWTPKIGKDYSLRDFVRFATGTI